MPRASTESIITHAIAQRDSMERNAKMILINAEAIHVKTMQHALTGKITIHAIA